MILSVYSCESFRLSQPFRAKFSSLSIQTVRGGLENLVKLIRRNILQTPKSTWVEKVQRNQLRGPSVTDATTTETPKREVSITEQSRQTSSKFPKKDFIAKNRDSLNKVKKLEYDHAKDDVANVRRRSRNSSVEERLIRSTSVIDTEFRPSRRQSNDEKFAVSHSFEEVALNPEMLAEIIKYYTFLNKAPQKLIFLLQEKGRNCLPERFNPHESSFTFKQYSPASNRGKTKRYRQ